MEISFTVFWEKMPFKDLGDDVDVGYSKLKVSLSQISQETDAIVS